MLQDAHMHLHDSGVEAGNILAAARSRGVGRFFCNSASSDDWPKVKVLADAHKSVIPFFGVHPWYADKAVEGWDEELIKYLSEPKARIGEIGLDAAKKNIGLEAQRKIFSRQLDIAVELKKPFAVHCVQAWDLLMEELMTRAKKIPAFMIHWFSGSPEMAAELIRLGGYISFSPRLLYERALKHRASFDASLADRILLETDYPYTPDTGGGGPPDAAKYFEWLHSLYGIAALLKNTKAETFTDKVWDNGTVFLH